MADLQLCINCGQQFDPEKQHPYGSFDCSYHPKEAKSIGNTGPRKDYAELWHFPCCGKREIGEIVDGNDVRPKTSPGCANGFHKSHAGAIFISYARANVYVAEELERLLHTGGYFVWRDISDLGAGQHWSDMIEQAISRSSHFILILSSHSVNSTEVRREINLAAQARIPIVPILIEDCSIPDDLRKINYIDWNNKDISVYQRGHPSFERLTKSLRYHVAQ
jgi:hypothetical protein